MYIGLLSYSLLLSFYHTPHSFPYTSKVYHLDVVPVRIKDEGSIISWDIVSFPRRSVILRARFPTEYDNNVSSLTF